MSFDYLRRPEDITRRSFETIGEEVDFSAIPESLRPVAMRLVHACALPGIVPDLAWYGDVAAAGKAALESGAPILCDAQMVAHGIDASCLTAGNEVICTLRGDGVAERAKAAGITRSAAALDDWLDHLDGAIAVIGNAPTALFRLLEMIAEGTPRPALILSFPVGYVGAAESKEALIAEASSHGLTCLTLRGRFGGSALAAAALNALARAQGGWGAGDTGGELMTSSPWLRVIGIGEDGLDGLSVQCRHYVEEAEVLVGGARHLAFVPPCGAERLTWGTPFSATLDAIAGHEGRRVVVLASGDPMEYGVGVDLARRFSVDDMAIFPAAGAFSLACARLGWPRAEVETLTLHGRPLALLNAHLRPGARLLILSEDGATPAAVAAILRDKGFGPSRLTVLERRGGPHEERRDGLAEEWDEAPCHDLNTMAVECRIEKGTLALPRIPGLPDTAFLNDGQLTKQTLRSAALAALAPLPGALLWDVGAGSGSIAIEWLRAEPTSQAVAVERDPVRAGRVVENAEALGVPRLEVITGEAPQALADLASPDAVFVGGGVSADGLLEACWQALTPGGRLVANAVTEKGQDRLAAFFRAEGGSLTRIAVSHAEPGSGDAPLAWHDKHPVTQLAVEKSQ